MVSPARKRSKKNVVTGPPPQLSVNLSIINRDWERGCARFEKYIVSQIGSKDSTLHFAARLKQFAFDIPDDDMTMLYERICTDDINGKWINETFNTPVRMLKAIATLLHLHNGHK